MARASGERSKRRIRQAIHRICVFAINSKVSIVEIRKTAMENSIGRVGTFTRVTISMIRDRAMARCIGLTATFTEVTGCRACRME